MRLFKQSLFNGLSKDNGNIAAVVVYIAVPCTAVIANGVTPFDNTCDAALIVSPVLPL